MISIAEIMPAVGTPDKKDLGISAARFYLVEWSKKRVAPSHSIVLAYDAVEAVALARIRNPGRHFSDVLPYEPSWPEHFTRKSGSKMWPPLDKKDSPFDEFTCKHCGEKLSVQMNGAFPIGQGPEVQLKLATDNHLRRCAKLGVVA